MHAITSSLLAALLAAAPATAAPGTVPLHHFAQEYNLVDGIPCAQQPNNTFACSEDNINSVVFMQANAPGTIVIHSPTATALMGYKVECGGPEAFTFFTEAEFFTEAGAGGRFEVDPCVGKNITSVMTVKAKNQFKIPSYGQELSFTDADPCTQNADGAFTCGGGTTIGPVAGSEGINITLAQGAGDTAIRATCSAGSSVFFVSAGSGQALFNTPSVCGDGKITAAVNVRSRVAIVYPDGCTYDKSLCYDLQLY
ncbi:hypothetical protein CSUB01_04281 [Colletotrichum sublineola]|uniref:Uncharacterized protein n=1 Tax=Colletotrichum sublineola TaxID=1173701 RepID=A0A066X677_COLSU|nr:hypothetical protein CSUB01_04281 [Colletotrichum sublineola]